MKNILCIGVGYVGGAIMAMLVHVIGIDTRIGLKFLKASDVW